MSPSSAKVAIPYLIGVLDSEKEASMVKHEAVIALGTISKDKSLISKYFSSKDQIVYESCLVAFDEAKL